MSFKLLVNSLSFVGDLLLLFLLFLLFLLMVVVLVFLIWLLLWLWMWLLLLLATFAFLSMVAYLVILYGSYESSFPLLVHWY